MEVDIKVVICAGTACHIMGGSELFLVKDRLDPALARRVAIEGSPCLDRCHAPSDKRPAGGAPYALVDGVTIEHADIDTLAAAIRARAETP